jgi:hypothetical protein
MDIPILFFSDVKKPLVGGPAQIEEGKNHLGTQIFGTG